MRVNKLLQSYWRPLWTNGIVLFLSIISASWLPAQSVSLTESQRYEEVSPFISADGNTLYFTRQDHPRNQGPRNQGDIWIRQLQPDGQWGRSLNAGSPINSFSEDLLIGVSADENRLAVVRQGPAPYLDILQKGDRSWRILDSYTLPPNLKAAHFDLETQRLVFSRMGEDGQLDLYWQNALPSTGEWSEAEPLFLVNSPLAEDYPFLTYDGRRLYFKRGGSWFMSSYRPEEKTFGVPRELEGLIDRNLRRLSLAVTQTESLVGESDNGQIVGSPLPPEARPSPSRLLSGTVNRPPAPGQSFGSTRVRLLIDGQERSVYPDRRGNYKLAVPSENNAQIIAEAPGYFAPSRALIAKEELDGGYASTIGEQFSPEYRARESRIASLHQRIAATKEKMSALQEQRKAISQNIRREQLATGRAILDGFSDPELEQLRARLQRAQENLQDTLPPAAPERLATKGPIDFDELEQMKARYRAQQEELLKDSGSSDFQWRDRNPVALRRDVEKAMVDNLIPLVTNSLAAQAWEETPIDSLEMEQSIRYNLFPSQAPAVYERESWENELVKDLQPRTTNKIQARLEETVRESVAADRVLVNDYRQLAADLDDYRDSLQREVALQLAEENVTGNPQPSFTAKGIPTAPVTAYDRTVSTDLSLVPLTPGSSFVLEQLQFEPNTAVLKPSSHPEMNRLVKLLKDNPNILIEIGAHTNDQLSYLKAQELSEQRALVVAQYILHEGIPLERLRHRGYGRRQPIADNATPNGRARNQRIAISIVSSVTPK